VAGHGKVAFVEFEGPPVVGEPPIAGASQTRWIPIWQRSLVRHLDRKVDTRGVAAEHEQVRWWLEQFGKGLAGYVTVPPSRIARDLRAVAERDRLDPPVEGAKKE
jgi:hypothetical protein